MKLKLPGRRGWIFALVTGIVVLASPFVLTIHAGGGFWEKVPGWWAWFGGIGCAVIVLVSKWLGHVFLQKPEDWYD
jgi:hypothetical protein